MRYALPVMAPVDPEGKFTAEAGDLQGESVFKADPRIIQKLIENGALLKEDKLTHSYPHCWRCKKPVIFRATEQWFISMEKNDLRNQALRAIDEVKWIPPWGRDRIRGMLESATGLVHLAPALLGRADPGGVLQEMQSSSADPGDLRSRRGNF